MAKVPRAVTGIVGGTVCDRVMMGLTGGRQALGSVLSDLFSSLVVFLVTLVVGGPATGVGVPVGALVPGRIVGSADRSGESPPLLFGGSGDRTVGFTVVCILLVWGSWGHTVLLDST